MLLFCDFFWQADFKVLRRLPKTFVKYLNINVLRDRGAGVTQETAEARRVQATLMLKGGIGVTKGMVEEMSHPGTFARPGERGPE